MNAAGVAVRAAGTLDAIMLAAVSDTLVMLAAFGALGAIMGVIREDSKKCLGKRFKEERQCGGLQGGWMPATTLGHFKPNWTLPRYTGTGAGSV